MKSATHDHNSWTREFWGFTFGTRSFRADGQKFSKELVEKKRRRDQRRKEGKR